MNCKTIMQYIGNYAMDYFAYFTIACVKVGVNSIIRKSAENGNAFSKSLCEELGIGYHYTIGERERVIGFRG